MSEATAPAPAPVVETSGETSLPHETPLPRDMASYMTNGPSVVVTGPLSADSSNCLDCAKPESLLSHSVTALPRPLTMTGAAREPPEPLTDTSPGPDT